MLATYFLESIAHKFIQARGNLMAPDVPAESLSNTREVWAHKSVPEGDQRVGDEITTIPLFRTGNSSMCAIIEPHSSSLRFPARAAPESQNF
jgi:hypothetical protein